jgi:hypothetical protein
MRPESSGDFEPPSLPASQREAFTLKYPLLFDYELQPMSYELERLKPTFSLHFK